MLFCLDLTREHQRLVETSEAAQKTSESYKTQTHKDRRRGTHAHLHDTMNRCKLVIGHREHVEHDERMHGDLYSCLILKL